MINYYPDSRKNVVSFWFKKYINFEDVKKYLLKGKQKYLSLLHSDKNYIFNHELASIDLSKLMYNKYGDTKIQYIEDKYLKDEIMTL